MRFFKIFCKGSKQAGEIPPLDSAYSYPIAIPKERVGEFSKISFPQADTLFSPPLFWPTEKWKGGSRSGFRHIKNVYQTLYATMEDMGCFVNRCPPEDADLVFDWSEKHDSSQMNENRIIIEHGWLPRSSYQVSPLGTNSRSHVAMNYRLRDLNTAEENYVLKQISVMKKVFSLKVIKNNVGKIDSTVKKPFVFFPFQLATDFNLRYSNSIFSEFYSQDPKDNGRFAQACIDLMENAHFPFPVIYKQHPADKNRLADIVNIKNKKSLLIENHEGISSSDVLSSDNCKLIISINSNTLHEALVWGVRGISLGTLLWDEDTPHRPFPKDISDDDFFLRKDVAIDKKTISYLFNVFSNQWYLSDFQNPLIVEQLIRHKGAIVPLHLREAFGFGIHSAL